MVFAPDLFASHLIDIHVRRGIGSFANAIRRLPIERGGKNTHSSATLVPDDALDLRFPRLAAPLSYGQGPATQVPFRVKKRVLHVASGDEVSMQRNKSKAFPSPGLAESRTCRVPDSGLRSSEGDGLDRMSVNC